MGSEELVVVAMSGGVDSSVAAALLAEQGYDSIGMMLRLWSETPGNSGSRHNRCCAPEAVERARQVAAQCDIPFYVVDASEVFHRKVVEFFVDGYASGSTPNPCLECNRHIRWDVEALAESVHRRQFAVLVEIDAIRQYSDALRFDTPFNKLFMLHFIQGVKPGGILENAIPKQTIIAGFKRYPSHNARQSTLRC